MAHSYKKRDIIEVIGEYVELDKRGTAKRPYYNGLCPLHQDSDPSLVVYPAIQRWICWGCHPEYSDVIEFVKLYKETVDGVHLSYEEAEAQASELISAEDAFMGVLGGRDHRDLKIDNKLVAQRMHMLHDVHDFEQAEQIKWRYDQAIKEGRWLEADQILRKAGV